jgi:hypothetical protein
MMPFRARGLLKFVIPMAHKVHSLAWGQIMIICIEEFLQEVHQPTVRTTETAAAPEIGKGSDDKGPNDDPPVAIRLVA